MRNYIVRGGLGVFAVLVALLPFAMSGGGGLAILRAEAATIVESKGICRAKLSGEIQKGDAAQVAALERQIVVDDGESTARSVICLDSPGGDLTEGLQIARYVLEKGIGTRVERGARCYSVCALIFMMGNARGAEVSFISRVVEVGGVLGFHRPALVPGLDSGYSAAELSAAYDLANDDFYELLYLAASPEPWGAGQMIDAELLREMIRTPSSDMYIIRRVEEALRWKIAIEGVPESSSNDSFSLMLACENMLTKSVVRASKIRGGGITSDAIFGFGSLNAYTVNATVVERKPIAGGRSAVESPRSGYSQVGCTFSRKGEALLVCGVDETTGTSLGSCEGSDFVRVDPLAMFHPASELVAIAVLRGAAAAARSIGCKVLTKTGEVLDDEVCLQIVKPSTKAGASVVLHLFLWPSGSRTTVEVEPVAYSKPDGRVWINGSAGRRVSGGGECILNDDSGNTLCISPR